MNEAHENLLKRRLLTNRSTAPSALLAKAQAAHTLADALVPLPIDRVRSELEWVLQVAERDGRWQSDRAANVAGRVLDLMDLDPAECEAEDGSELPLPWRDPVFTTDEDRLVELELNVLYEMGRALKWLVDQSEWRSGDTPRMRWLIDEAERILDTADPCTAADQWLSDPPKSEPCRDPHVQRLRWRTDPCRGLEIPRGFTRA